MKNVAKAITMAMMIMSYQTCVSLTHVVAVKPCDLR